MNDRGLGYTLAVIFGMAGLLLFVVSLAAPGVVENSTITLIGGVFGIGLALLFGVTTMVRKRCHRVRAAQPDDTCVTESSPH